MNNKIRILRFFVRASLALMHLSINDQAEHRKWRKYHYIKKKQLKEMRDYAKLQDEK